MNKTKHSIVLLLQLLFIVIHHDLILIVNHKLKKVQCQQIYYNHANLTYMIFKQINHLSLLRHPIANVTMLINYHVSIQTSG